MRTLEPGGEVAASSALAPGDVVEVRFSYTPDLNITQTVRPDGKITLELIGEVHVQGLTPVEVEEKLRQLYEVELKEPEVVVLLRSQHARRVYVGGEVNNPGLIDMPARMTLLEAIMRARGANPASAGLANVLVIRDKDGKRLVGSVDLRPSLGLKEPKPGEAFQPFYLQPGDVVYVPETRIVRIDRWIDQHINKIIPATGLVITTTTGTTGIGHSTAP